MNTTIKARLHRRFLLRFLGARFRGVQTTGDSNRRGIASTLHHRKIAAQITAKVASVNGPLESTHRELSFEYSHTFRFRWTVQNLVFFSGLVKFAFGSERVET